MAEALSALLYPLPFVLIVSLVILVHELGHYTIAVLCRMPVESVSIGFGREWLARTCGDGTRWRLGLIPFGGSVIVGNAARPFLDEPLPARAIVTLGGPLANFAFAILLMACVFLWEGELVDPVDPGGSPSHVFVHRSPVEAIGHATIKVGDIAVTSLARSWRALSDHGSGQAVQGVGSVVEATHATAANGWDSLAWLTALISIGIGLFNLLPVPVLDGGQLVLIAFQAFAGHPPPQRTVNGVNWAGIVILATLALIGMGDDLMTSPIATWLGLRG
jgi:regulator of sigma E protease